MPTHPQNGPDCEIGWVMEDAAKALGQYGGWLTAAGRAAGRAAGPDEGRSLQSSCVGLGCNARCVWLDSCTIAAGWGCCLVGTCFHSLLHHPATPAGVVPEKCNPYNETAGNSTCPSSACTAVPPGKLSTVTFNTTVVRAPPGHCYLGITWVLASGCGGWAPANMWADPPLPRPSRSCSSTSCNTAPSSPPSW